jgi:RNA polymerase sigma-70 factor, ECF subfamily
MASLQTAEPIDWPQVAGLYRRLADLSGSPVVELNRAAALAQAGDPAGGRSRRDLRSWLAWIGVNG